MSLVTRLDTKRDQATILIIDLLQKRYTGMALGRHPTPEGSGDIVRKTWLMAPIVVMAAFGLVAADSVHPSVAADVHTVNVSQLANNMLQENLYLSLIHISEPTRPCGTSRMPSSA